MLPLLGVVVGAVLGYFFQRAGQSISRRERWSDRASEALADVKQLLTVSQPHRVTMNMNRETVTEEVSALSDRGALVRREVSVLGAGHPDPTIRSRADGLEVAMFNADVSLRWLVNDLLRNADITETSLPKALAEHDHADELRLAIIEQLHARDGARLFKRRRTRSRTVAPMPIADSS